MKGKNIMKIIINFSNKDSIIKDIHLPKEGHKVQLLDFDVEGTITSITDINGKSIVSYISQDIPLIKTKTMTLDINLPPSQLYYYNEIEEKLKQIHQSIHDLDTNYLRHIDQCLTDTLFWIKQ
jgi:hypothetical protein